jgi:hypothetical protein
MSGDATIAGLDGLNSVHHITLKVCGGVTAVIAKV